MNLPPSPALESHIDSVITNPAAYSQQVLIDEDINVGNTAQEQVLEFIERTFQAVLYEFNVRPCGRPAITIKRITDIKSNIDPLTKSVHRAIVSREVTYSFPGKTKAEAWRFACLGRLLTEIFAAIRTGVKVTKRDIYYRDPNLYKSQNTVDRFVDDIAFTCGVTRKDLKVQHDLAYLLTYRDGQIASPKGLVAGLRPDPEPDGRNQIEIIPDSEITLENLTLGQVNWILVIEKEATFRSLFESKIYRCSNSGPGLLITGKGFPDLATRQFLRAYLDHRRSKGISPPVVFGLFDYDPDGINIMQTYRLGSIKLAHEHGCTVPEMQWLGVKLDDISPSALDNRGALELNARDRDKARAMLARQEDFLGDTLQDHCFAELRRMLILNMKAEIQILNLNPGGVAGWVEDRLCKELGITQVEEMLMEIDS